MEMINLGKGLVLSSEKYPNAYFDWQGIHGAIFLDMYDDIDYETRKALIELGFNEIDRQFFIR